MSTTMNFNGKVAIVTGAGRGIGRQVAIELGSRGAKVLVNDNNVSLDGESYSPIRFADQVVATIREAGGEAFANYDTVENGQGIVGDAVRIWGKVDIVINNAGFLRDSAFHKMTEKDWDLVHGAHVRGAFMVTRAAWPYMRSQKYGRIINTTSPAGLYGNFGQANYSAAKLGLVGFTNTLAREGASKGIQVNIIAPMADSRMTKGVLVGDLLSSVATENVVPLTTYLAHESCTHNGGLFEVGGGWIANLRWQRTKGVSFDFPLTPEAYASKFDEIANFDGEVEYPKDGNASIGKMLENFERNNQLKLQGQKTGADDLKANEIFELIHNFLIKEGADAVKTCKALYNFEITEKKKGKVLRTWGVDLKNGTGCVSLKPFGKPDSVFKMTDADFFKVCMGQLNPQIAFLQGKMKIRGNMKKATVFTPELFHKPTPENFAAYKGAKL